MDCMVTNVIVINGTHFCRHESCLKRKAHLIIQHCHYKSVVYLMSKGISSAQEKTVTGINKILLEAKVNKYTNLSPEMKK